MAKLAAELAFQAMLQNQERCLSCSFGHERTTTGKVEFFCRRPVGSGQRNVNQADRLALRRSSWPRNPRGGNRQIGAKGASGALCHLPGAFRTDSSPGGERLVAHPKQ